MAKERLQKKGISNVSYIQGDAASLAAGSESYDLVLLASVLGEIPDKEQCLQEIRRVLKSQGLLSICEQPGDPNFIKLESLQKKVEKQGFVLEKTYGYSRNYTAIFRKH